MPEANLPPGYWMYETSGMLRPAIEAYLKGSAMSVLQVAYMRAYLRQWIDATTWIGPAVEELRRRIDGMTTQADIAGWLEIAELEGIDPL